MSTVLRIDGLRFVIWPNDHSPAHVHVFSADGEAKIELTSANGFPRLIENRRMKHYELAKALAAVFANQQKLTAEWKVLHGKLDR